MHMTLAPLLFARVMALPAAAREDLLEFIGGATVDESKVSALIDEISTRVEKTRQSTTVPS